MDVSPVSSRLPESSGSPPTAPKQLKLLTTVDVDPEDKENADPRSNIKVHDRKQPLKDSGNLASFRIHKREDKGKEKALKVQSPAKSDDGFEVSDDLRLDNVSVNEANENLCDTDEEAASPVISTLFRNKVTFMPDSTSKKLCSDSTQNGASPLLSLPQPSERRRLDFDSILAGGGNRRGGFRRCMSMVEQPSPSQRSPPPSNDVTDFTSPVSRHSGTAGFKRPIAPLLLSEDIAESASSSQGPSKKRRPLNEGMRSCSSPAIGEGKTQRVLSRSKSMLDPAAAAQIMHACNLVDDQANLTGDTRSQLSLPTVKGSAKNHDLKNVDCHTLANVIAGKYDDKIAKLRIIDARYCYEYEGGHITGAENFGAWDEDAFLNEFFPTSLGAKQFKASTKEDGKREILVFHCEFSSARGPALMRKLRSK